MVLPKVYKGKQPINCISVDRIDSSKGYTKDNIQLTLADVNIMKWNTSDDDFIATCKLIHSHFS